MKIDATLEEINEINEKLKIKAGEVRKAIDSFQYEKAKEILLNETLTIVPNHPVMLEDLGFLENKLKNYEKAFEYSMLAIKHSNDGVSPMVYDNLTSICRELKRFEEERYYGRLAIKAKKEEAKRLEKVKYPIPDKKVPGLSSDKNKNIISYSLYGSNPRYCETAISATELASQIYPEWTCRFYVDETVPLHVIKRLEKKGAQIKFVTEEEKKISGLFWRFFVVDDPEVQCFIVRDADSLLSYKEKAAVDDWINSGKWFHIMRDATLHTELILAGMWGGYTGVFKNMREISQQFFDNLDIINKTIDQVFLRQLVWPTVSQDVLIHDNRMLEDGSKCYPDYEISDIEKIPYFHIGMIDAASQTTTVYLDNETRESVTWFLVDENRNVICSYEGKVTENENKEKVLVINLPYFHSMNIKNNKWEILVERNNNDDTNETEKKYELQVENIFKK